MAKFIRNTICLLAILLSTASIAFVSPFAASDTLSLLPSCGGVYQKCGYVDRVTKLEVIPQKFQKTFRFSETLGRVQFDGKFGFVDKAGDIVIEAKFDSAGDFYSGLAEVLVDGKVGVINTRGDLLIKPRFARAIPFTSKVIIAQKYEVTHVKLKPFARLDNLNGLLLPYAQPSGLYHLEKGWLTEQKYYFHSFEKNGRGLIWATTSRHGRGLFGLMSSTGSWEVKPTFSHVQTLHENRAVVRIPPIKAREKTLDKSGAVNENGKLVIPAEFEFLSYWNNGYGLARKGKLNGLVDKAGNLLGNQYFDKVVRPENGKPAQALLNGKWISFKGDGSHGNDSDSDEGNTIAACPNDLEFVRHGDKFKVIVKHNENTSPLLVEEIGNYGFKNGRYVLNCKWPISVSINGQWQYLALNGKLLFDEPIFDGTYKFRDGYAIVNIGKQWGVIDVTGNYTIGLRHGRIVYYKNGIFRIIEEDEISWVDVNGESVTEPRADAADRQKYLVCKAGARLIEKNDLWGIQSPDGSKLIEQKYRAINCFRNGVAWAAIDAKKMWCAINPDGTMSDSIKCKLTHYPYFQTHSLPEKFSNDVYESSVLWMRAFLNFGNNKRELPPKWIPDGYSPSYSVFRK